MLQLELEHHYSRNYTVGERLDIVEAFLENASLCHSVRKNFMKVFPDLYRVMKKLQKGKGSLMVCLNRVANNFNNIPCKTLN